MRTRLSTYVQLYTHPEYGPEQNIAVIKRDRGGYLVEFLDADPIANAEYFDSVWTARERLTQLGYKRDTAESREEFRQARREYFKDRL